MNDDATRSRTEHPPRLLPPRIFTALAAVLALVTVGHLAGGEEEADSEVRHPVSKRVRVETARAAGESPAIWFPGVARAQRRSRVAFALAGRLTSRGPSLGDHVSKGAVLARLDARKQSLALDAARASQAEATVRKAEAIRDRDRVARLAADGAATTEELESLQAVVDAMVAVVDAAAARVGDAERQQGETVLRAPFAGTVTAVFAEPGEFRSVGQPILELSGDGAVEVELAVPESLITGLSPGTEVAVRKPAQAASVEAGRILTIGSASGRARALFPVLVSLDDSTLAGTSIEVSLRPESASPEASVADDVIVPIDAVVDPSGRQPVVFRLHEKDGGARVERVPVAIGVLVDGWVTVRGSLAAGDRVVVAGQRGLLHDDVVEPVP